MNLFDGIFNQLPDEYDELSADEIARMYVDGLMYPDFFEKQLKKKGGDDQLSEGLRQKVQLARNTRNNRVGR